jgi:hypothetical protein
MKENQPLPLDPPDSAPGAPDASNVPLLRPCPRDTICGGSWFT